MDQRRQPDARCGGFTMIELLVVVSIVVLLASMLFPIMGIASRNALQRKADALLTTVHRGLVQYREHFGEWPRVLAESDYLDGNGLALALCHPAPDAGLRQTDFLIDEVDPQRLSDRDSDGVMDDIRDPFPSTLHPQGRALVYVEYSTYQNPNRTTAVGPGDEVAFENRSGSDLYDQPISGYRGSYELWSAGRDGEFSATRGAGVNEDNRSMTAPYGDFSAQ